MRSSHSTFQLKIAQSKQAMQTVTSKIIKKSTAIQSEYRQIDRRLAELQSSWGEGLDGHDRKKQNVELIIR